MERRSFRAVSCRPLMTVPESRGTRMQRDGAGPVRVTGSAIAERRQRIKMNCPRMIGDSSAWE